MNLIEEYLQITGRPAATLSVDEFVLLVKAEKRKETPVREYVNAQVAISQTEPVREEKTEELEQKSVPEKSVKKEEVNSSNSETVKNSKAKPKQTASPTKKSSALDLLRSVSG